MSSVMDGRGVVHLPLSTPLDPDRVGEAAAETFLLEPWTSHESPLCIRIEPDRAVFDLDDAAQEAFVIPYVRAIHGKIGNQRPVLLNLPPKPFETEERFLREGVTGRISALEIWNSEVFNALGPKHGPATRNLWIERILGQAYVYLGNLSQPLLLVGKELCQPGGFTDVEQALRSTQEGIQFFLEHRIAVRLAHWNPPAASGRA